MNCNELFDYRDGKLFNKSGVEVGSGGTFKRDGKFTKTHRAIWEAVNGPIPDGMWIDHINHDRSDNRIENLRLATPSQNAQNRWHNGYSKVGNKYKASIGVHGKKRHLGYYSNPYEAHGAYLIAKQELCGEFAPI